MIRWRRLAPLAISAIAIVLLAGCAISPASLSTDTGVNDTITEIKATDRGKPIVFGGDLDVDGTVKSSEWLGSVVVVNFWYAACAPCRAEAPNLEALHEKYASAGVVFIGINVRDTLPTARAFAEKYSITYPSIMDSEESAAQLAFAGQAAPNAVPTTIVLDRQGRVASRIIGQIPTRQTLASLIDTTLAERNG